MGHNFFEHQQADQTLSVSEARYRAMVSAVPDLMFLIGQDHRFIDVLTAHPQRLAVPPEQLIGKTISEVFGSHLANSSDGFEDARAFAGQLIEAIERATASGEVVNFEYRFGPQFYEARIVCTENSEVLAIARDITQSKTAELSRRTSEERLTLALAASKQGLWDWDLVTNKIFLSPECHALVGYDIGEVPESFEFFYNRLHPDDVQRVDAMMKSRPQDDNPLAVVEYRVKKKTGSYVWLRGTGGVTARNAAGKPLRMTGVIMDITAQKDAEEKLQKAIQAREDLLAIVSHDLRTPLNTVQLSATLLAEELPIDQRLTSRQQVEVILRSSEQMTQLIDNLLQASTLEAGTFSIRAEPQDVYPIVHVLLQTFSTLAARKSVLLARDVPFRLPQINCDRQRLQQVLSNLVGNALKFSPAGGTITVSAEALEKDVVFMVQDQGAGISARELPWVFERYRQGDEEHRGTGLGLFIARGIVEEHGGQIWVDSKPGQGAAFFFTIPIAAQPATAARSHRANQ